MADYESNPPSALSDPKQDRLHAYMELRFQSAIALLAFFDAIGIGFMIAGIFVPLGLAISLIAIPMIFAIYFKHLRDLWRSLPASSDLATPTRLELATILGIVYLIPIISIAVFLKVEAPSAKPDTPTSPISISPAEARSLREMSKGDFLTLLAKLTQELREVDTTYGNEEEAIFENRSLIDPNDKEARQKDWINKINLENQLSSRFNREWQTKYRNRARAVYEDLCRRLGIVPDAPSDQFGLPIGQLEAISLLQTGMLAGAHPVSALADYLDSLARDLQ